MEQPLLYWVPSIAPSGMTFYDKDLFKDWKGDLLISALAGEQLRRVELKAGKVLRQETFLTELKTRFRNIITQLIAGYYRNWHQPQATLPKTEIRCEK